MYIIHISSQTNDISQIFLKYNVYAKISRGTKVLIQARLPACLEENHISFIPKQRFLGKPVVIFLLFSKKMSASQHGADVEYGCGRNVQGWILLLYPITLTQKQTMLIIGTFLLLIYEGQGNRRKYIRRNCLRRNSQVDKTS